MDRRSFLPRGASLFTLGLTVLNAATLLAGGVWLIHHDQAKLVAILCWAGLAFALALPLLLRPARLIRERALDSFALRRGPGIAIYLWLAAGHGWSFALLGAWACGSLGLGLAGAVPYELPARLLLVYGIAVLPWSLLDQFLRQRRSLYLLGCDAPEPVLFLQLGSLGAVLFYWMNGSIDLCVGIVAAALAVSFCCELGEACQRVHRGRLLLNTPVEIGASRLPMRKMLGAGAGVIIGTAGLFILDITTPAGVGDGFGYCFVLPLCLWLPWRRMLPIAGVGLTVLTLIGAVVVPASDVGLLGTCVNRTVVIVSIWGIYFLLARPHLIGTLLKLAVQRQATARAAG